MTLLFALDVDDLLTTVEAVRADVVTKVNFTGLRFNSRSRVRQEVMSTVVTALVGRFFILLDCHSNTPRLKTKNYTQVVTVMPTMIHEGAKKVWLLYQFFFIKSRKFAKGFGFFAISS